MVWCRGYGEYRFRFNYPHVNVIVNTESFRLWNSNIYTPYSFNSIINNTDDPSWNDIWKDLNNNNEYVWGGYSYKEDTWYPIEIQLHTVGNCEYPVIRGEIL